MKERITYRNRIEVKILSIAIAIIWGILYTIILIGDLRTQSPHFLHNQMCLHHHSKAIEIVRHPTTQKHLHYKSIFHNSLQLAKKAEKSAFLQKGCP